MNSKEALENLTYCVNGMESTEKYYKIVKKDLDQLELINCLVKRLGIDLFILFGALKNGIYYKSFDGYIEHISYRVLTLSYNYGFNIWVEGHRKFDGLLIDFKDYGKTWALTKEELQDDK